MLTVALAKQALSTPAGCPAIFQKSASKLLLSAEPAVRQWAVKSAIC